MLGGSVSGGTGPRWRGGGGGHACVFLFINSQIYNGAVSSCLVRLMESFSVCGCSQLPSAAAEFIHTRYAQPRKVGVASVCFCEVKRSSLKACASMAMERN